MTPFAPPHEITHNGCTIAVHDCEGVLYTREEWEADAQADWERDVDGNVLFQGSVPTGDYSIRKL